MSRAGCPGVDVAEELPAVVGCDGEPVAGPVGGTISEVGRCASCLGAAVEPAFGPPGGISLRSFFSVGDAAPAGAADIGVAEPVGPEPSVPAFTGPIAEFDGVVPGDAVGSPVGRVVVGEPELGAPLGRPPGMDVVAVDGDAVLAG